MLNQIMTHTTHLINRVQRVYMLTLYMYDPFPKQGKFLVLQIITTHILGKFMPLRFFTTILSI